MERSLFDDFYKSADWEREVRASEAGRPREVQGEAEAAAAARPVGDRRELPRVAERGRHDPPSAIPVQC